MTQPESWAGIWTQTCRLEAVKTRLGQTQLLSLCYRSRFEHDGLISTGAIQGLGTELLSQLLSWVLRRFAAARSARRDSVRQSITGLGASLLLHTGSKLKISAGLSLAPDFSKTSEQFLL